MCFEIMRILSQSVFEDAAFTVFRARELPTPKTLQKHEVLYKSHPITLASARKISCRFDKKLLSVKKPLAIVRTRFHCETK